MTTREHLARLGVHEPLAPDLDALRLLHARHLERVPYENLGAVLGRAPSVDAASCVERVVTLGRAGYCFHQNAALEQLLLGLGYVVERWHGHVWFTEGARWTGTLNHLALVVPGLPTDDNPGGRWWVDVGLGDGFREPLPMVAGVHEQDGFRYELAEVRADGWSYRHDPRCTWTGLEVSDSAVTPAAVLAAHAGLTTPPDGAFSRVLVVQRRDRTGVDALRCCLLRRIEPGGTTETVLSTYDEWRAALTDALGLPVDDVPDDELRALHGRMWDVHLAWEAAGRP